MRENTISYQEYREQLSLMADRIVNEQSDADSRPLSESVFSAVDQHKWVMYYSYNTQVLEQSSSEPTEWEHLAGDSANWKELIQAMAFDVLRQDLWAELRDRDDIDA
jgi:hypothetical protein